MNELVLTLVAAFVATSAMTLVVYILRWAGVLKIDVIEAIGAAFDKNEKSAFVAGLVLHYIFGFLFTVIYMLLAYYLVSSVQVSSSVLAVCVSLGFFQGLVVAFSTNIIVTEHHSLKRFRNRGVGVSFAYLLAHIVFGLVLGIVLTAFNYQEKFIGIAA